MKRKAGFACVALIAGALGCSSSTTGANNGGSGAAAYAGTYAGTYVGVYTITSPVAEGEASNTESGTFVFSAPTAGTLEVDATFTGAGGITGRCTVSGVANGDTATSSPADQTCTYNVTGGTQTNDGPSAFTLSGNTITDVVGGTFTGSNASGTYGGTFSGTWTLTWQE